VAKAPVNSRLEIAVENVSLWGENAGAREGKTWFGGGANVKVLIFRFSTSGEADKQLFGRALT